MRHLITCLFIISLSGSCTESYEDSSNLLFDGKDLLSELIDKTGTLKDIIMNSDSKTRNVVFESVEFQKVLKGEENIEAFLILNFGIDEDFFKSIEKKKQVFMAKYGSEAYFKLIDEQIGNDFLKHCNCGQSVFDSLFGTIAYGGAAISCVFGNAIGCIGVGYGIHRGGIQDVIDSWGDVVDCGCFSDQNSSGHN